MRCGNLRLVDDAQPVQNRLTLDTMLDLLERGLTECI
jgi:hypothetical protein